MTETQERLIVLSYKSCNKIKVPKVFNWDSTGFPEKNTINIIKDYKLAEKRKIQLPDYITGIFKCPNLRCVTVGENIKSVIEVIDKEKIILKCKYCGRILSIDELIF